MTLNPLEMEDTLIPIVQFFQFDGSFLKSIRFVSKLWNEVALKQFRKSNFLRIPPNFSSPDEKDAAALSQLEEFLKRFERIQSISLSNDFSNDMKIFGSLEPQVQFQIHWEKITQLRINFKYERDYRKRHKNEVRTKFIREMLIKCENLKFLDIPPQSDSTFSEETGLGLMKSCIKLDKNENLTISNLAAAVSTERDVKIVIEFSETGVRILNFLAKPLSQIKEDCPSEIPALIKAFEKIMESNKNHLISLGVNDQREILLPDFELPEKMEQLETLNLSMDRNSHLTFKLGFQFHRNFPNLKQVNLKLHLWPGTADESRFWTNLFQNQQPSYTVKKLELFSFQRFEEEIFQVFPGIEELKFCENVVVMSPEIFQFLQRNCKHLRILQLDVPSNILHWHRRQIRLVSNLSGFSMQVLKNLMLPKTSKLMDHFIRKTFGYPRWPAFSILKNLEQLDLIWDSEEELWDFCDMYMSFLDKYVFSPMPKLKVERHYRKYIPEDVANQSPE